MSVDERTLAELRREIAEAHALATRTHTAVTTLAGSLKEVVTRQDKYERGLNLNSFVAYALFTILLGGGFTMLYRSRAEHLVSDRDTALRVRSEALTQAAAAKQQLEEREAGSRKAEELWALLQDGRRADMIARLPELTGARMSTVEKQVLEQSGARARAELVDSSFTAGVEAVKGQQWKRAVAELVRALSYEDQGPRSLQMRYYYGVALLKQGEHQEAAKQLDLAIAGGVEKNVGPDARYYLASALELGQQLDRARVEYLRFADGHWDHAFAPGARRKAAEILRTSREGYSSVQPGNGPPSKR